MYVNLYVYVCLLVILQAASATRIHGYNGVKQLLTFNKFKSSQHQYNKPSCFPHKSRTEKGATVLELHHRDYCSRNWNQKLGKHIQSDEQRVHSLQWRIKTALSHGFNQQLSQTRIPLTSGVKLETLNYVVTVGLGGRNATILVDTGSDLTWVQCQPCSSCYNQQEPIFDPSKSPNFESINCKSSTCQNLEFATGDPGVCGNNATCQYYVTYGDGSYTRGDLAYDNVVLGTTIVKGFVFGCGRNNKGLFGGASGIMGLGRSPLSLISQTSEVFGGVFSYCLPSVTDDGSGSLILGDESLIYKNFSPISYTKMIKNPILPTFYFLNLTGISIGGVALNDSSFGKFEMLIDSGTVITRLRPSVYNVVKSEFLKQFSGFPKASPYTILDTCFDLSAYEEVDIPTIEIHFGDGDLTVDVNGVLYFAKADATQVCLAMASLSDDEEIGIIGNYQQRNTRVIYNTKASTLGFAKETCSPI